MIDIHCHILPEVDDGSHSMNSSIEMARIAKRNGTDVIVATPHCNIPGLYRNYYGPWFDQLFDETKMILADHGIELLPGMEVFSTFDVPQLIDEGRVLTLNQSRYLLIEFDFGISYTNAMDIINRIKERKLVPVLAHAERFDFIRENPHRAFIMSEEGVILQANKGSFMGDFGSRVQKAAFLLLKHGLYSVVASDGHNYTNRNTDLREAYRELRHEVSEKNLDALFMENPERIILDKEITPFEKYDFI